MHVVLRPLHLTLRYERLRKGEKYNNNSPPPPTFVKTIVGFVNADGKEQEKLIIRGKMTVLLEQGSVIKNSAATLEGK